MAMGDASSIDAKLAAIALDLGVDGGSATADAAANVAPFHHRPVEASASFDHDQVLAQMEDAVVQEALRSGEDLRDYSRRVDGQLRQVERGAVQDYLRQAPHIAALHTELTGCDRVLERMEAMLAGFQDDLGNISHDILHLQGESARLNERLRNRQQVRSQLSQYVDDIIVPQQMIRHIYETPVTEREFLEQLHELQHKVEFVKAQEFRDAKAAIDVRPVVEHLTIKALDKIREFILQKIYQFRKPLTNYQVPQDSLLKFRFYYEFLLANRRDVAEEIRDEYVDTAGKIFYSYFKTYCGRLMKLQHSDVATKEDLLGAEDTTRVASFFSSKPQVRNRATVFSMGSRVEILNPESLNAPIIVPHAAQQAAEKYQLEALFRSVHCALADHASREYLFATDFFLATDPQEALRIFGQILGRVVGIVAKTVEEQSAQSFDAMALFLCVQLCHRFRDLLHKRDIPALDGYWNNILAVLWARFQAVMHLHIESLRTAEPRRLGDIDTRPHYVVRRYAELVSGLLAAAAGAAEDERLRALTTRLQAEIEQLLTRLGAELKASGRRQQLVCLINNYDLVVSVLAERLSEGSREAESFKELLQTHAAAYVDETLFPHFGALTKFVDECESLIEQQHAQLLARHVEKAANIVQSFGSGWKAAIAQINAEVMRSFSNFKNGTAILQMALTVLMQYHQRLQKVMAHEAFASCPARHQLVNSHHIMVELKKYKPDF